MTYRETFDAALQDPAAFWLEQSQLINWYQAPSVALDTDDDGYGSWFADGQLNTAYLALDVHIEAGRGEQKALIYDSPATGSQQTFTFLELRDRVARFAGVLAAQGVVKGDRVIIYMPMIPEAVIAMLACARLGAIHSVVFGGFAPRELATRIDDATPKVLLAASCGIEFDKIIPYKPLVDEALQVAEHQVEACIVLQREQSVADLGPSDHDWRDLEAAAQPADCVPVSSQDPLYILYTSGTTGKPKGVVRDNGGHAVAMAYSMKYLYSMSAGEVFWAASDVGWVVGHSYIVYGPLIAGCTTILFEGKPVRTPDAGTFWRIIAEHDVNVFFTAPTAFRAIKKEDPEAKLLEQYDLSCLRYLFVAGERTDPPTYHWLCDILNKPVIDHWWQTETGWPIAACPMGIEDQTRKPGSVSLPVPGYDIHILSADHQPLAPGEEGDITVKLPLPPGCLPTVWGDHQRFQNSYLRAHPGFYQTGDEGYLDEEGYLYVMGRTDDVINVAGHRLSTGAMEEIVASHAAVAECAVIGVEDADKGQVPVGFVLLKDGVNISEADLQVDLISMMRQEVGAFANFKTALLVKRLPKTRSGKILRQVMRKIADDKPYETPATIDDPTILDEIKAGLVAAGVGRLAGEKKS